MTGEVFVTVGTTSFDALVQVVDSSECRDALLKQGYSSMLIQLGRGSYIPSKSSQDKDLGVDFFTFAPDLSQFMSSADLIISHAGSGSIFESLHMHKPLIVVVNEALMDNHQAELAEELAMSRYLFCATPATLVDTIKNMDLQTVVPYEPGNPASLVQSIYEFLGFDDE
eukprot:c27595_g2_i5 orf=285-791(+)